MKTSRRIITRSIWYSGQLVNRRLRNVPPPLATSLVGVRLTSPVAGQGTHRGTTLTPAARALLAVLTEARRRAHDILFARRGSVELL